MPVASKIVKITDVAMETGEGGEHIDEDVAAAESVADRYRALWEELTHEETFGPDERYKVEARVRRLNELGFAVDELALEPTGGDRSRLRLKVAVANRRFHAIELQRLTGLEVGEGQATILRNDLRAYQSRLAGEGAHVELTAVGDNVNVAARLASLAETGEALISADAAAASNLDPALERRTLDLKGALQRFDVRQ